MTLEELIICFRQNLTDKPFYTPVPRPPRRPMRDSSYTHHLYPIRNLRPLIEILKKIDEEDGDQKYSVRYLVTREGRLLCALEGRPGRSIPEHKQMRASCLAAGNIYFSADFTEITKITHRSGDFHPAVASLVWPIAAVHLSGATLAKRLIVEESNVDDEGRFNTVALHHFTSPMIETLFSAEIRAQIIAANEDTTIEVSESLKHGFGKRFFDESASASAAPQKKTSHKRLFAAEKDDIGDDWDTPESAAATVAVPEASSRLGYS